MVFNTILQAGSQPTSLRPGANYLSMEISNTGCDV